MSEASDDLTTTNVPDQSKVKLVGFTELGVAIFDHVPGWFGEACGSFRVTKVGAKGDDGQDESYLSVKTPTTTDKCKVGDVIKCSLNGGLFVRHFSPR